MNNYYVYMHKNLFNNKIYIGITKKKPEYRWNNGNGYKKNKEFFEDIILYGWKNFEHIILFSNLTKEEANKKEIELIKQYDTRNPEKGYNKSEGGETEPGDFTKMIEWQRTHKKFGEENCHSKKVKCINTGDIFGSIMEAERWSNSSKVGEVCRGNRLYAGTHPITKEKLKWAFADENEKVTIECHINKREQNKIKKIKCITTGEIFENGKDAERKTGICVCNILRVCRGERKTAGKMKWKYYEEGE